MRCFPKLVAILFITVSLAGPVSADAIISGPACVIDGNTIQVGGNIKNRKCWGGIDVRLHGSIAPQLNQACTDARGDAWDCGKKARDALKKLIRLKNISCYHLHGEFDDTTPLVTCISGRLDLALEMVTMGMAKVKHDQSKRYELEEAAARKEKRGIWR